MRRAAAAPAAVIAIAATLAGCNTATPSGGPDGASPTSSSSFASAGPAASTPLVLPPVIEGPGDFVLGWTAKTLANLPSHRSTLVVTFEGTIAGQAAAWSTRSELVVQRDPGVRALTIEHEGPVPEDEAAAGTFVLVGGAAYTIGDEGCDASVYSGTPEAWAAEPIEAMPGLVGATSAGRETVNGVEVDSFTFDGLALGVPDAAQASGRVSVTSAGMVVHYETTETGSEDVFGDGVSGTMTMRYDLFDVGVAVAPELAPECPPGLLDFLVPTDATGLESNPGSMRFTLPGNVAKAVGVVRGGGVIAHWSEKSAVILDDEAHFEYTADGLAIDVFLAASGGSTEVQILAVRA
jgi:hypothetical protein